MKLEIDMDQLVGNMFKNLPRSDIFDNQFVILGETGRFISGKSEISMHLENWKDLIVQFLLNKGFALGNRLTICDQKENCQLIVDAEGYYLPGISFIGEE